MDCNPHAHGTPFCLRLSYTVRLRLLKRLFHGFLQHLLFSHGVCGLAFIRFDERQHCPRNIRSQARSGEGTTLTRRSISAHTTTERTLCCEISSHTDGGNVEQFLPCARVQHDDGGKLCQAVQLCAPLSLLGHNKPLDSHMHTRGLSTRVNGNCARNPSKVPTCQNTRCAITNCFTCELPHTSRFRT